MRNLIFNKLNFLRADKFLEIANYLSKFQWVLLPLHFCTQSIYFYGLVTAVRNYALNGGSSMKINCQDSANLFINQILSIRYMPSTVLGTGDTAALMKLTFK